MRKAWYLSVVGNFAWMLVAAGFAICTALGAQGNLASSSAQAPNSTERSDRHAEAELQTGIQLTRRGLFSEAIPHFLAAQGGVSNEYAVDFNLALCYIGTREFPRAIKLLNSLRNDGKATASVENLLAQAYIGNGRSEEAFAALQRASKLTPKDEKLYIFVSDACADRDDSVLGLRVVDFGLQHLPNSARLHYQRANFLAALDHLDAAKEDFELASSLEPNTEVAFDAAAQKNFLAGNLPEAIQAARAAVREHHANYLTLAILGDALLRTGATPGEPEFAEAESALKESVAARPDYARAQIAMGYLFLVNDKPAEALPYLEKGRQLDPRNPSVYRHLARAYQKLGKPQQAQEMLATLASLNAQEAQKINTAPGERKAIPGRDHTYP
jgi:predicted Zn-dependent protease